jgi:hypothetical protein
MNPQHQQRFRRGLLHLLRMGLICLLVCAAGSEGKGETSTLGLGIGVHYYAISNLSNPAIPVLRGKAGSQGYAHDLIILAPNTQYREWILHLQTMRVAVTNYTTPDVGRNFQLPEFQLRTTTSPDSDGDGFHDLAEFILGTNPNRADSDGDGVQDAAEVLDGTDPLDGLPAGIGIIAATDTPGTAVDICAINDIAIVANREAGVSVLNVGGQNPIRIAEVDTPGTAVRVACSGNLIAVADGPAGLAIIDIADPPASRITHQISLGSSALAIAAGGSVAFVGLDSGEIVAVDLPNGLVLSRRQLGASVRDVVLSGDHLLAVTSSALVVLNPYELDLPTVGSTPANGALRLVAGNGLAYVTVSGGFDVFAVAANGSLALIRQNRPGQVGWRHLVANGSGLGIAAVSVDLFGSPEVELYTLPSPSQPPQFATQIRTPHNATAISIYNGRAYVADGLSGLQVINYLAYDSSTTPPAITLSASFGTNNLAEEGKLVRVTAAVTDDVQVRNVEFYVDGVRVVTDGNFPFEHRFVTPLLSATKTNFTIRAKATDTGGNFAWSDEITGTLVHDITPPRVVRRFPNPQAIVGAINLIAGYFDEPIATTTLDNSTFTVSFAGSDGIFGTSDDAPVTYGSLSYRDDLNATFMNFPTNLPPGVYRASINPPVADLSGNQLRTASAWQFWVLGFDDRDQDGVPDSVENALGLNPDNPDTDGDGVLDGNEDLDGDGLRTSWELVFGYDPRNSDSNTNGIFDGLEDLDFDTLNNLAEMDGRLNPVNGDSDGDGWDDATEFRDGTNPLDPNSGPSVTAIGSQQVAYFNGASESPPSNALWSAASSAVACFNGAHDTTPTNTTFAAFSSTVSYFNGQHEQSPTDSIWCTTSPTVAYFNGAHESPLTNAMFSVVSPTVSYFNGQQDEASPSNLWFILSLPASYLNATNSAPLLLLNSQ